MGRKQGPTPIQFDNKCAVGILTDTVVQRRSKAMDMRFYWTHDRARQGQFYIHWKEGSKNLADYPSKNHPTKHHIEIRPTYVLNNVKIHLQKALQAKSQQRYCKGVFKPIISNGQPKPLANRYNQYLSRKQYRCK